MADLAALQAEMAQALLAGRLEDIGTKVQPGPILAREALSVHRDTALGGLRHVLRLGYPTVLALVGEDFFDQAALAFIQRAPPSSAWLTGYGEGFADFLADDEHARELPYLADVARFDFAVEAAGNAEAGQDGPALDLGEAVLRLDASLRIVELDYPADAIRDALAEDEARLAEIDMRRHRRPLALWRLSDGAGVRRLGPVSAAFVQGVLAGEDLSAFEASEADLRTLSDEVFSAPFARLSLKSRDGDFP